MEHAFPLAGQTILAVSIKGPPVQWARARVGGGAETGVGRQRSFHTAPAQKRYKGLVRDEGRLAMLTAKARRQHDGKPVPLGTPVIFEALVFLPIPSSFTRSEEAAALAGELRPTGKPDLDNWVKLPMDALEGIVYANDSQVVGFGNSGVWYSNKPRLELHVYYAPIGLPFDRPAVDLALRNLRALVAPWSIQTSRTGGDEGALTGADLVDTIRNALGFEPMGVTTDEG